MIVRIKTTPREREIDGIRLDHFAPGSIREVSPSIGAWLVAQGYAELEMRRQPSGSEGWDDFRDRFSDFSGTNNDRRRRR